MDKLAEEILKGCEHDGSYIPVTEVKRLMQTYHKAKRKDDLVKFAQYINKIGWSIPKNEVDEYLKQR
jgi:hypothetical protein